MFHTIAIAIVLSTLVYLAVTLVLSRRKRPIPMTGPLPERFIFVVPACNEARVIVPTLDGLLAACGDRGRVLVIDDGSEDGTGELIETVRVRHPEQLIVLTRRAPMAKLGKGAALNHAFAVIRELARTEGLSESGIVLGIVDADGRLEADVLDRIGPYFRDQEVGAVQLLVRIRNREKLLGRFQDYEFTLFSALTQTAREKLGSVGLGGNGQFTRLAALAELGDAPWSDCLTEDLDLGLRLAIAGWENRFCGETFVDQQGLNAIRPLLRQRTRWAQGHFQCWKLLPRIVASPLPTLTVLDLSYYLMAPAIALVASILFTAPLVWGTWNLVAHSAQWFSLFGLVYFALLYLFSFGPAILMSIIYRRRTRDISIGYSLVLGHLLIVYNYLWYIAEWRALGRIIGRRNGWSKTNRSVEGKPTGARHRRPAGQAA